MKYFFFFFNLICFLLGYSHLGLPRWLSGKGSTCNAGDVGLIPGSKNALEKEMLAWEISQTPEPGDL